MAQSLIACPLCSTASFSSTSALCLSLVNVASKRLRCTLCEEELHGIDKLTIHLLGHLINNNDFRRTMATNNTCFTEPLNLVKIQNEQLLEARDNGMMVDKKVDSNMFKPNGTMEEKSDRFSLKIDDEVMIFFNSKEKTRCSSEAQKNSQINNRLMENIMGTLDETPTTTSLPNLKLNFIKSISDRIDENQKSLTDQQSQINSTPHFIFSLDKNPINNCIIHPEIPEMSLSPIHKEKEISLFEDEFNVKQKVSSQYNEEHIKNSFLSPNGERVLGYRCDICSLVFPDEHILSMHRQLIHVELRDPSKTRTFKCHLCSKSFVMKGSLMVHMRVAHFGGAVVARLVEAKQLETNAVSPESAQFVCSVCNKGFKKEQQLIQHEKLHDGKQCDVCLKTFTTKYFLRKHKRLHTGEMPYTCHVCNKSFTFQQSYHKHLLYHSDDKPHTCPDCGRAFKELSTLHNHQRIHTGEKPFSCETCGKCFRQRVSYLVHRRIHTGVMPYRCQECGKTFRYKVSERTHKCAASNTKGSSDTSEPTATATSQEAIPPNELLNKSSDLQLISESSGNVVKEWHSKEGQTISSQMEEKNGNYPDQTDFFSMVMSPSDRLQNLNLCGEGHSDCSRQDNIDTESLRQLLYDVADYS